MSESEEEPVQHKEEDKNADVSSDEDVPDRKKKEKEADNENDRDEMNEAMNWEEVPEDLEGEYENEMGYRIEPFAVSTERKYGNFTADGFFKFDKEKRATLNEDWEEKDAWARELMEQEREERIKALKKRKAAAKQRLGNAAKGIKTPAEEPGETTETTTDSQPQTATAPTTDPTDSTEPPSKKRKVTFEDKLNEHEQFWSNTTNKNGKPPEKDEQYAILAEILLEGETVKKAMNRLCPKKGGTGVGIGGKNSWKNKQKQKQQLKKGSVVEESDVQVSTDKNDEVDTKEKQNKALFDKLVEAADGLLAIGEYDAYGTTKERAARIVEKMKADDIF